MPREDAGRIPRRTERSRRPRSSRHDPGVCDSERERERERARKERKRERRRERERESARGRDESDARDGKRTTRD